MGLALDFVEALKQRRYQQAYAMTSSDFIDEEGTRLSVDDRREKFELIVSKDWVFVDMDDLFGQPPPPLLKAKHIRGPLAIMEAETSWVEEPDIAFFYVSIADQEEGEALSVFVTREPSGLKIREVSFGRP